MKFNLIIDGNYLMYRSVFILQNYKSTFNDDLPTLLRKDFEKIIKTFSYDKIYFISDSGSSWRKNIYPDYKGQRKKDESIDWKIVYEEYDTFKEELKAKNNCQVVQIDSSEGDDIIGYIVKNSNLRGYSNVIVANDGDLQQLLTFGLDPEYLNLMWNHKMNDEKIYLPENYEVFLTEMEKKYQQEEDIFNLNNNVEFIHFVDQLVNKTKIKNVNHEKSLFIKIYKGDTGDNIPSIVKMKDGRIDLKEGRGIGETGAEKCYETYKEIYPEIIDFTSEKFLQRSMEVAAFYKKVQDTEIRNEIKKQIQLNLKLIYLNESYLPVSIRQQLKENINF